MFRLSWILATLICSFATAATAENWPAWRGLRGDGSCLEKNVPTKWDGPAGNNVVWKVPVPGNGHASPIVWGDRIFLVSCLTDDQQRVLMCLDRDDGKTIWQETVVRARLEKKHGLNSFASGTPTTDGELVYVTFLEPDVQDSPDLRQKSRLLSAGRMVVAAYDFDGKRRWVVRPGRFASIHGYCSSPILYEDKLIINGDHDGDAYLVALDRKTGKTLWKVQRENKTRSYCTPIIRTIDGRVQMMLSGSKCVASFDPQQGTRHWIIDGPTEQFVASLVYNDKHKLLFMTAGFPDHHMMAIRPTGDGNVTQTHVAWRTRKACSYVPSPIAVGDFFLVVSDNGVASCFDAASGERLWMERIGRHYSASPVAAGGLAYFLDDDGTTKVIRPGPKLDVVATNPLGEHCYASPAISDKFVFLRSEKQLWCLGDQSAN